MKHDFKKNKMGMYQCEKCGKLPSISLPDKCEQETPDKGKKVEIGESVGADTALIGCYLMKAGIAREEKEEIKNKVAEIIIFNRKQAKQEVIEEIRRWAEEFRIHSNVEDNDYRRGMAYENNYILDCLIHLLDKIKSISL